jgi:hypothetical protein
MGDAGRRDVDDVLILDPIPAAHQGEGAGDVKKVQRGARGCPEFNVAPFAGCADEPDDGALQVGMAIYLELLSARGTDGVEGYHWLESGKQEFGGIVVNHGNLRLLVGIAEGEPDHETVKLGGWQGIGSLRFDRVLRRDDEKTVSDASGHPARGNLPFRHDLKQGGLYLRRRAVNLVGKEDIGKDRPRHERKAAFSGVENVDAGYVVGSKSGVH